VSLKFAGNEIYQVWYPYAKEKGIAGIKFTCSIAGAIMAFEGFSGVEAKRTHR
jgi:hypothetical protein